MGATDFPEVVKRVFADFARASARRNSAIVRLRTCGLAGHLVLTYVRYGIAVIARCTVPPPDASGGPRSVSGAWSYSIGAHVGPNPFQLGQRQYKWKAEIDSLPLRIKACVHHDITFTFAYHTDTIR